MAFVQLARNRKGMISYLQVPDAVSREVGLVVGPKGNFRAMLDMYRI